MTRRRVLLLAALALAAPAIALPGAGARTAAPTTGVVAIRTNLSYQNTAAAGTGMVIAPGVVLTNNHVIRGATTLQVVLPSTGRAYAGTVAGYDISDDVAVVRLKSGTGLARIPLGTSTGLRVGQTVTAVGNAGGRGVLVTARGTITALGRTITAQDDQGGSEQLHGLIQTDASLQPGDSGGPLLNAAGRVVGMDTAASTAFAFQSGSNEAYAIPIDRALTIARQIQAGRSSATVHVGPTAFLGVSVVTSGAYVAGHYVSGALAAGVVGGGPAEQAGIRQGDLIVAVAGRAVPSAAALLPVLQRHRPGDAVTVAWYGSDGARHAAAVRLGTGPPQ